MRLIAIDFETYYAKDFSLTKLTTEEYIRSDRFEIIGVAVKDGDEDTQWFSGTLAETIAWLKQFPWETSKALAHNASFDGAILSWVCGIKPKKWLDTLSMGRAIHGVEVGNSLKVLVERYGLGAKGTEVLDALGKRRDMFTPEELSRYGKYCINDVELTVALLGKLGKNFSEIEVDVVDITIRMFTEPVLMLELPMLEQHLENVKTNKEKLLLAAAANKDDLMSNPKFAGLLEMLGIDPPMKTSLRTGKIAYAFAKTDEGMKELQTHADVRVQVLVAARLGNKTTLEETRTQRFIDIAKRGRMPVPLKYYAAHTGRWGGEDKINLQNLPSRGENANRLKNAICAPDGYRIIDSDSSQIEARVLAWFAGQDDLVKAFALGEDVYSIMAAYIYNKEVSKVTKGERFVGKTTILGCISEGTLVLCDSGWKPIEQVTTSDKLWDGEEWVCHQGLLDKGWKETLSLSGVWLTPDHKVLCGTQWLEAQSVVADESILCQALATGVENLPLLAISQGYAREYERLLLSVDVVTPSTLLTTRTSGYSKAPDAIHVQRSPAIELANYTGVIAKYSQMTSIVRGYLTGFQAVLADAIQRLAEHFLTMVGGVYLYTPRGGRIEGHFYNTLSPLQVGKNQSMTSTALIRTKGTNLITYGLQLDRKTQKTNEKLKYYRRNLRTYDLAYAGPRNRYTIATTAGPIIVHNCGYGMGDKKFRAQLKTFGVDIPETEAIRIIKAYRTTYTSIPKLWSNAQSALQTVFEKKAYNLGREGVVFFNYNEKGFQLPNDLWQKYDGLEQIQSPDGRTQYEYKTRKGMVKIYGGKVIENLCQALARCIIAEQMVQISKRYRVVLTVHDAIVSVVREEEVDEARAYIETCMRTAPAWAKGLPLNCESGVGESYGECF
jgi:DNA polymerase I-like protein with 3'-5' exonuclease and polymerase domains